MIDARELRIGNYVYGYKTTWTIDKNDFRDVDLDDNSMPYNPIPLTEEWLLKLGFKDARSNELELYPIKYNTKTIRYNGINTNLYVSDFGDDSHYDLPCPHIKYVHQLQNIYFALTGEELTIRE